MKESKWSQRSEIHRASQHATCRKDLLDLTDCVHTTSDVNQMEMTLDHCVHLFCVEGDCLIATWDSGSAKAFSGEEGLIRMP